MSKQTTLVGRDDGAGMSIPCDFCLPDEIAEARAAASAEPGHDDRGLLAHRHLRGVQVLNINELANALKPVVLPGEFMKVFILKEGKEYNQGVAYLDDGTMVVTEQGAQHLGETVHLVCQENHPDRYDFIASAIRLCASA